MARLSTELVLGCLKQLIRPIVSFSVRHSVSIQALTDVLKETFVDVAAQELLNSGETPNVSRVSVLTGIHRKDVTQLMKGKGRPTRVPGLLDRVMGLWQHGTEFTTEQGAPRVLRCDSSEGEFYQLVQSVSRDLNPHTVLSELKRVGAVEVQGAIARLRMQVYMPKGDPQKGIRILAADTEDITRAVEENIFGSRTCPHLHIRTEYDNLLSEKLPEIEQWLLREGTLFHQRAREFLSQYDVDINKRLRGSKGGGRVVLGAFSRSDHVASRDVVNPKNKAETRKKL